MKNLITRLLGTYLNALSWIAPRTAARHAFNLFCHPFRINLRPHHEDFLNTSEKFRFTYKDLRLQGYKWGNGSRKVLFVHGWQSHTFRWKNYINALLKKDTTVYALDAPGHGYSEGRFLSVPLYSEIIEQFISEQGAMDSIVAHSLGSFAAVYALYRVPLLPVNRLVLTAPPGEASDFIDHFRNRLRLSPRTVGLALDYFQKEFEQPVTYFSTKRFAASLVVPGIIIHDKDDDETPFPHAREIHEVWKRSTLIQTRGLGHNLRSAEVTRIVCDYVTSESLPVHETAGTSTGNHNISVILPH